MCAHMYVFWDMKGGQNISLCLRSGRARPGQVGQALCSHLQVLGNKVMDSVHSVML